MEMNFIRFENSIECSILKDFFFVKKMFGIIKEDSLRLRSENDEETINLIITCFYV